MPEEVTLTDDERALAARIGFDEEVLRLVKHETGAATLGSVAKSDHWGAEEGGQLLQEEYALTAPMPRERTEEVRERLRDTLAPLGYLPFVADATFDFQKRRDTLAVLRSADPLAPLRFVGTSAPNYDLNPEDVLAKVEEWHDRYGVEVIGAEGDSLDIRFGALPDDLYAFAEELYDFCPDLLDQGMEVMVDEGYEMLSPEQQERVDALTAADTGDEEGRTHRVALRLLAETVGTDPTVRLWWD
jgi:hypothetical protein